MRAVVLCSDLYSNFPSVASAALQDTQSHCPATLLQGWTPRCGRERQAALFIKEYLLINVA